MTAPKVLAANSGFSGNTERSNHSVPQIVPQCLLLAGDILVFLGAFYLVRFPDLRAPLMFYRLAQGSTVNITSSGFDWYLIPCVACCLYFIIIGQYSKRRILWEDGRQILRAATLGCLADLVMMLGIVRPHQNFLIPLTWVVATFGLMASRYCIKHALLKVHWWQIPAVIVGTGPNARNTYAMLRSEPILGFSCETFVELTDDPEKHMTHGAPITVDRQSVPVLFWSPRDVGYAEFAEKMHFVVALEDGNVGLAEPLINELSRLPTSFHIVPPVQGFSLFGVDVQPIFGRELLLLQVRNNLGSWTLSLVKRLVDIVASSALIILLSPILIAIAIMCGAMGGPTIFRQQRVGQMGKAFQMLKFRTMHPDAEMLLRDLLARDPEARAEWQLNFKLKNDPRITSVGKVLRRFSLDELPQLFNVLLGEMSLVGPRPIVEEEVSRYGKEIHFYLMVKPGITGLWQVSGRNDADYSYRIFLDAWYARNWSLWYDFVILAKTVPAVIGRSGAY